MSPKEDVVSGGLGCGIDITYGELLMVNLCYEIRPGWLQCFQMQVFFFFCFYDSHLGGPFSESNQKIIILLVALLIHFTLIFILHFRVSLLNFTTCSSAAYYFSATTTAKMSCYSAHVEELTTKRWIDDDKPIGAIPHGIIETLHRQ